MRLFSLALMIVCGSCLAGNAASPLEGPGNFVRIGGVTLNKHERSVTFAAAVSMNEGLVEYALVVETGKAHESLLVTKTKPFDVHLAMLLLGVKPTREIDDAPPDHLTNASLEKMDGLTGDPVEITVAWKQGETARQAPLEEFISDKETKAAMAQGPWIYTGSALYKKRFLAQTEGSIIALVIDPSALINNPRPGNRDDSIWMVQTKKTPPVGTPVEVTIKFRKEKAEKNAEENAKNASADDPKP